MKKLKRSDQKRITLPGQILRYMRMTRRISMREAGRRVGCSDSAISHYEQGRMDVSPERVRRMVESYGFSMAAKFHRTGTTRFQMLGTMRFHASGTT